MSDLDSLYTQVMVDHVKHPRHRGLLPSATVESCQRNTSCGDEITLQLELDGDRIVDAAWSGQGCMLSQSSASILAEQVHGLTVAELVGRIESFRTSMRSRGTIPVDEAVLGDAVALEGASRLIARVKCAMLAWVAAEDALTRR